MDSTVYNRVEFLGNSCGQHGSYTFYRGIRYWKDDRCHSLSIGEFFHGRLTSGDQVIPLIGELQLLWEEKNREGLKLSSVRLYILPENCPAGRLPNHGQDEILAEDDKIVLRVEDLMKLVVLEPVVWPKGLLATHRIFPQSNLSCLNDDNNEGESMYNNNSNRSRCEDGRDAAVGGSTRVVIFGYARYCRYRAALRRFEGCANRCLADVMVAAISGFATGGGETETRVMFCRSTVEHPVVENYEHRMNHLAPSLKGRRRKKRPKSKPNESEDSNESETSSEKSTLQCSSTAEEDALAKHQPTQKFSELNRPKPKAKKSSLLTEKCFLKRLHKYMNDRGTPIVRIPILGFKEVNLFQFYQCTQQLGGYDTVTERRLWKIVYDQLGGSPGNTSAATGTRKNYEKLLLEFECHVQSRKKPVSINGKLRPVDSDRNFLAPNSSSVPKDVETGHTTGYKDSSVGDLAAPKTETEKTEEQEQEPLETDHTEHPNTTEIKMAIQLPNRQRKLLRKTSILTCGDVKKNLNNDLVETYFPDGREEEIVEHLPSKDPPHNLTIPDLKPKIDAAHTSLSQKDVDRSQNNSKVSAVPCTVSLEIIKDKFCKKPEVNVEDSFCGIVKMEKPEPFPSKLTFIEVADKCMEEYLSSFDKTDSSPVLDSGCHESQNSVSCVGPSSKSQKIQQSYSTEALSMGKETCASTKAAASTIEASSISRKLLSGGCAVVETGALDKDRQSSCFLKLDAPCMSSMLPVRNLGDELSESLSSSHGFKDVVASSYAFSAVQLMISSPALVSGQSSFMPSEPLLSLGGTSCLSAPSRTDHPSLLNIPIPFDTARSNDNRPRSASLNRCQSAKATVHSLAADSSPSLKRYLLSTEMKRSHSATNPPVESTVICTKRYKGELENYADSSSVERSQQMCRTSVISSPIKRFIEGTKRWIPPLDPNQTINDAQKLSLAPPDEQPTDLSMKTLTSRVSAPEFAQDEPLDLSKKSSALCRARLNEPGVKPVVLPGCSLTVPSPTVLRNGLSMSPASTNKVAFVAPSLRSTSSFAPVTNYQMSGLHSGAGLASSSLPQNLNSMRTDQISPLVAYAPSFHPAFQILSAPILSAVATSGSLLGSSSTISPRLAVPFFPVIPIAQNSPSSSSAVEKVSEIGNTFLPTVLKRPSRK